MTKLLEFFGIPSPAWLIGMILALLTSGIGGMYFGVSVGRNEVKADLADSHKQALDILNAQLTSARAEAQVEAAKRGEVLAQADAAKANLTTALRDLRNAKNKPAPECITPDWRMRVNSVVSTVNRPVVGVSSPGGMSIEVPTASASGVGLRRMGGGSALDGGGVRSPTRDVPPTSEAVIEAVK